MGCWFGGYPCCLELHPFRFGGSVCFLSWQGGEFRGLCPSPQRFWVTRGICSTGSSSLAVFKARLDGAWSTLIWWKVSLPVAGGLELDDLSGPFQPKPFYDLGKGFLLTCLLQRETRAAALSWHRAAGSSL